MEKVGLFHFVAEPYLMDFRGRVTLPMIGNYLIHAASSHAGERGFGFNDMSERHTAGMCDGGERRKLISEKAKYYADWNYVLYHVFSEFSEWLRCQ